MLSKVGQGKLMGSICCTQIPFILIAINQLHLSPLSRPYSANPPADLETHIGTGTIELFFVITLTIPLCLPSLYQSHLITPSFRNYDDSAYCQTC